MTRDPVRLLVLLFFAALAIAALSVNVPGATYGIKGDESTYVAMALSVAHDGDIAYAREDVTRFFRTYGRGPDGIFLKPGQGAAAARNHLYFGKSYIYSLVAAPFARIAGLNGLLAFNVALLAGVFLCLYAYASVRLSPCGAALMSTAFIGASVVPLYGVFLAPETFNLALVCFAYFLWLYKEVAPEPERLPALLRGRRADLLAAALLGLVVFSKPSNLPLIAPLAALSCLRRRYVDGALVAVACCAVAVACFTVNLWITGEWNYQGGLERKTFYGRFPFEHPADDYDSLGRSVVTNRIRFSVSDETLPQFARNLLYFVAGRHFGLAPYFFPGVVAVAWMLRSRNRDAWQGLIAGTLALSACGLLLLLPNAWSGGGGPLGNRYFLGFYPAFFFLLPAGRSIVPGLLAWGGGALFVSQVLVAPFVAAKYPWLIAEQGPLRMLPVELTMVNDLPVRLHLTRSRVGYNTNPGLLLYYLDDNAARPEDDPGIWVLGGKRAEVIVSADEPLTAFTVRLSAPIDNRVTVTVDGTSRSVNLRRDESAELTFPVRGVPAAGAQHFLVSITPRDGMVPRLLNPNTPDARSLGVRIRFTPHAAVD